MHPWEPRSKRLCSAGLLACLFSVPLWSVDSALQFTRVLGGSSNEQASAIATDPSGFVLVGGSTTSRDFPVTNGSILQGTQFAVSDDSGRTWRPLNNLPSGTPNSLTIDSSAHPIWYSTGFKSADGGTTWQPTGTAIDKLVIDPLHPSTLYGISDNALVKSTDAGATWTPLNSPIPNARGLTYLALDPFHPDHLFTAFVRDSYRSFDGGQTWTQYTAPLLHPDNFCGSAMSPIAFDAATPNLLYVVEHCDVFRSTDGGIYWAPVTGPFQYSYGVAADPHRGGTLYVSASDGLYATYDSGATWKLLLVKPNNQSPPPFVAVDPAHPTTIIAGNQRSQDGGATWTPLALGRLANAAVFDPTTAGRVVVATPGAQSGFLAKLDSAGTILLSTYFGGQGDTRINGIASDRDGNVFVSGSTTSPDSPGPFVAKFDANLQPVYWKVLPNAVIGGVAVDADGNAVTAGSTALNRAPICFVTKLNHDGTDAIFFKTFGGTNADWCSAVAADAAGNTIVGGYTFSRDFPVMGAGAPTSLHGGKDAIVAKFDPAGNMVYSAYLGGADTDSAVDVAVDPAGNIYVAGQTASKDFPSANGHLHANCPYPSSTVATGFIGTIVHFDMDDAFVTKLDPGGNIVWSTYLGGDCLDSASHIALDGSGNIWIQGNTQSDPFPQVAPVQSGPRYSFYKTFVSELDPSGTSLKFSSYLNGATGMAADVFGNIWVGGATTAPVPSSSGPPAPPPVITGVHVSVAKLQTQFPAPITIQSVGNAFTFRSGPVSPGQITLIQADGIAPENPVDLTLTPSDPLPRTLAGTQVLFDGEPAALVSVSAGRAVAVAPYDLAGRKQTSVQVVFQGNASAPVLADILGDPGYLSADGSGTGQALARNPDGTLNSADNPAPRGSRVTVYLTGLGSAPVGCVEGAVAADATAVSPGVTTVPGSLCGLFQTTVAVPTFGPAKASLPNSALTYAVK